MSPDLAALHASLTDYQREVLDLRAADLADGPDACMCCLPQRMAAERSRFLAELRSERRHCIYREGARAILEADLPQPEPLETVHGNKPW